MNPIHHLFSGREVVEVMFSTDGREVYVAELDGERGDCRKKDFP